MGIKEIFKATVPGIIAALSIFFITNKTGIWSTIPVQDGNKIRFKIFKIGNFSGLGSDTYEIWFRFEDSLTVNKQRPIKIIDLEDSPNFLTRITVLKYPSPLEKGLEVVLGDGIYTCSVPLNTNVEGIAVSYDYHVKPIKVDSKYHVQKMNFWVYVYFYPLQIIIGITVVVYLLLYRNKLFGRFRQKPKVGF